MAPVLPNGTAILDVGWAPAGVILTTAGSSFSASGGSATGSGIGWAANGSDQGSGSATAIANAGNSRTQSNTAADGSRSVTGFTSTGITFSSLGSAVAGIFIGGTDITCTSGSFTSLTATGQQTIDLGIPAVRMVYLAGVGTVHLSSPDTSRAEWCIGGYDGVQAFSHWAAESGVGNPPNGARFLSSQKILQFGTPATLSSAITCSAEVVSLDGADLTINWSLNDGVAKEILWFAVGSPTPDIIIPDLVGCTSTLPN